MPEGRPSRYVKLTKAQNQTEDITPGELNQAVDVPQQTVHICHECGQPLPEAYEPPGDENWQTGICSCFKDPESCRTGFFCPCILFGTNIETLRDEIPWQNACICHAFCVEGGIAAATSTVIFSGVIDPQTTVLIFETLMFSWWLFAVYTGLFRQSLQRKYHLKDSPCDPCLVHCCMHWCAICQEHREMKCHLSEDESMEMTVVNPPPTQEMKSGDTQVSSSSGQSSGSSENSNNDNNNMALQPV